jgi:TolB protein
MLAAAFAAGFAALLTAACVAGQTSGGGQPSPSSSVAAGGSIAGLPGWLYYADYDRLLRLTSSDVETVLSTGAYKSNVSPDGASIALVDASGNVVVTDREGQNRRTVLPGRIPDGYEPAWSPDSQRLLAARGVSGGDITEPATVINSNLLAYTPN